MFHQCSTRAASTARGATAAAASAKNEERTISDVQEIRKGGEEGEAEGERGRQKGEGTDRLSDKICSTRD